jgi:DtxR family Mn-dependent transcriptional regulator
MRHSSPSVSVEREVAKEKAVRSEDYLALLYRLGEAGIEARLSIIAGELRVKAPTAAKALSKLREKGYVERKGLSYFLTEKGLKVAERIVRNHRIAERLLTDVLGVDQRDAHELAHELEHVDRLAELADRYLGSPDQCPHGNPVPSRSQLKGLPLSRAGEGVYRVARLGELGEVFEWAGRLGLKVGTRVEVEGVEGNYLLVRVEGGRIRLPMDIASLVYVERAG